MKKGRFLLIGFAVLVMVGALALSSMAKSEETVVEWDQVPANIQSAITAKLDGGKATKVEKETKKGADVYEVKGLQGEKTVSFLVTADGKVLDKEKEEADEENEEKEGKEADQEVVVASVADLPAPVRAQVEKIVAGNPIDKITSENEDGVQQYEVEYKVAGQQQSVNLSPAGDILELESQVEPSALPAAVQATLQKKFPGATVSGATSVQSFSYEIEIAKDGKKHEVKILATGNLQGRHEEEGEKAKHEEEEENESHAAKTEKKAEKPGESDDDD